MSKLGVRLVRILRAPALLRGVIGLLVLVVVVGLLGRFALPPILAHEAEKWVADKLHRKLSIDAITFNPLSLQLALRGVRLTELDGATLFASFDLLRGEVSGLSLLRLAPVIRALQLDAPFVHLVRIDSHHYNVDDLLDLGSPAPQPAQPAHAAQPPQPTRYAVYNIQIGAGRIEFDDQPEHAHHTVTGLQLGVPFISTLPSQVAIFVEPALRAVVDDAPLALSGKARPFAEPREASVDLNLDGLDLSRFVAYLPYQPRFRLPSAKLSTHLTASFRQPSGSPPTLVLTGTATLTALQVTALDGQPMIRVAEIALTLGSVDPFGGRIDLTRVALTDPALQVEREPDATLNLARLAPPAASSEPAASRASAAPGNTAPQIKIGELTIANGSVHYADAQAARPLHAGIDRLQLKIDAIAIDPGAPRIALDTIASGGATIQLALDKPHPVAAAGRGGAVRSRGVGAAAPAANQAGFEFALAHLALENWSVQIDDRGLPSPLQTTIAPISLKASDLATAPGQSGSVELAATLNRTGQLRVDGKLGIAPLHADLALDLKRIDLLPLQPLIADQVNLAVTHALLGSRGRLVVDQGSRGQFKAGFKGNLALASVKTVDRINGDDFVDWESLAFAGVDVQLQPARPEPVAVTIDQVALNGFFARLIVDPTGRINFQDVLRGRAEPARSLTSVAPPPATAATVARSAPPAAPAPQAQRSSGGTATAVVPIRIGKVTLQDGRVRFSDNFIKPNYTANLVELGGAVVGLSSDAASTAHVDLRGQVNNAPLSIAGTINPLKSDLVLDLKATVKGMELVPLNPYSGKYLGYGISKGKLTFDVGYKVENRRLTATNHLVLDQLTLGDKFESPSATHLPVSLALALMKDRNGVIDINLPIGGSLDDPQFSVGGIILRELLNLFEKIVTAPFALLGSLFGSTETLSSLEFEPGRATVGAAAQGQLGTLARALVERPGLTLEVTGRVDPQADREGLRRAALRRQVLAVKRQDLALKGDQTATQRNPKDAPELEVSPQEYPGLLARVYRAAKFPKPRNALGFNKDLPVEEMEKLLLANNQVGDAELAELGRRRAQSIQDWLVANGPLDAERIFIVDTPLAANAQVPDAAAAAAPATLHLSRADFSLR